MPRQRIVWVLEFAFGLVLPAIFLLPALFFDAIWILSIVGIGAHQLVTGAVKSGSAASVAVYSSFLGFFVFAFVAGCIGLVALTLSFFPGFIRRRRLVIAGLVVGQLNSVVLIFLSIYFGGPRWPEALDVGTLVLLSLPLLVSIHRLTILAKPSPMADAQRLTPAASLR